MLLNQGLASVKSKLLQLIHSFRISSFIGNFTYGSKYFWSIL